MASADSLARPDLHPINASDARPLDDSIARLQNRIDRGKVKLAYDDQHGWLASVLRELHVPISPQGLVFSKTSFQANRISRAHHGRSILMTIYILAGFRAEV